MTSKTSKDNNQFQHTQDRKISQLPTNSPVAALGERIDLFLHSIQRLREKPAITSTPIHPTHVPITVKKPHPTYSKRRGHEPAARCSRLAGTLDWSRGRASRWRIWGRDGPEACCQSRKRRECWGTPGPRACPCATPTLSSASSRGPEPASPFPSRPLSDDYDLDPDLLLLLLVSDEPTVMEQFSWSASASASASSPPPAFPLSEMDRDS